MDKSRLIGGIICLAVAVLLTVLNLSRPADQMMFMIGDTNIPWVPPIVLGIVGIVLLVTAGRRGEEVARSEELAVIDEDKAALNRRLETIAWGAS
jgi:hypothetical protein